MSAIRIIRGEYRGKTVSNQNFTLVSGFQTGAKGGYVTVQNNGTFPNCPATVRIRVNAISDYEMVNGDTVEMNTPAAKASAFVVETEEEAIDVIKRSKIEYLYLPKKQTLIIEKN